MPDNLAITPGVGALAKTDVGSVSGAHMQVVKLAVSADGDETLVPADATYGLAVEITRSNLPSGAATEATVAAIKTGTDKIPAAPAQEHVAAATPHAARLTDGSAFYKATTPSDTQPVSAATLPLPTGAAQEHVAFATPHAVRLSTGAAFYDAPVAAQLPPALVSGRLAVDGSGVTHPVSGTVTANQGTAAVVANAWPVKLSDGTDTVGISTVGAAKALKVDIVQAVGSSAQTDKAAFVEGTGKFEVIGGVYNEAISSDPTEDQAAAARITAKRAIHVNLRNVAGTEIGTAGAPVRVDPTGSTTQPVSGTVTANIGTVGTLLTEAGFQARVNTLGQKVMASSTPVVIASDQSAVPVSGTVTANQGTANATPWNENLKQVGGDAVVTAAAGVQKVGVVDEAGAAFSDSNPAPTEYAPLGRTRVRKAFTYGALETATAVWTPAGGKRWVITHMIITPTAAGALLKIFDNTDAAANMIYQGMPPLSTIVIPFPHLCPSGAVNNILRYSTGATAAGDVTLEGYEV